jgi:hypothetical protein
MDTLYEMLMSRGGHLIDRAGGPLNFRLVIMPLVIAFLAVKAGVKDAREGRPPFFWTLITKPLERRLLVRSALKDAGRIFIVAVVLDTAYQLFVLRAFYLGEMLVVAVACTILPYLLVRSAVSIPMRRIYRNRSKPAGQPAANPKEAAEDRPASTPNADH